MGCLNRQRWSEWLCGVVGHVYVSDSQHGDVLSVAPRPAMVLSPLELEDCHLGCLCSPHIMTKPLMVNNVSSNACVRVCVWGKPGSPSRMTLVCSSTVASTEALVRRGVPIAVKFLEPTSSTFRSTSFSPTPASNFSVMMLSPGWQANYFVLQDLGGGRARN